MRRDYVLNSRGGERRRFKSWKGKSDRHSTTLAAQWYESRMRSGKSDHFDVPSHKESSPPRAPWAQGIRRETETRKETHAHFRAFHSERTPSVSRHVQVITYRLHEAILPV